MKSNLKIVLRDITSITPYPDNPRKTEAAIEPVANSIREFGFRQPIVVDADGIIIIGHVRYQAAQTLGMDKVPVHVATDLTPDRVRALRIADNRTGEFADWDDDLLGKELSDMVLAGVDLQLTAFPDNELDSLLASVESQADPGLEIPYANDEAQTGIRAKLLRFERYKIPVTKDEAEMLELAIGRHVDSTGGYFGFVAAVIGGKYAQPQL